MGSDDYMARRQSANLEWLEAERDELVDKATTLFGEEKCEAVLDCRILPGQTSRSFMQKIKDTIDIDDIWAWGFRITDCQEILSIPRIYAGVNRKVNRIDNLGISGKVAITIISY